jgi:PAS domain S-box-containing protein
MGVEQYIDHLNAPAILAALLDEFSAVTDYRTLRDNLPRRLANLLRCRCVVLYQRIGETLQFASGSFADQPGWSSTLLAVAHINPIDLLSEVFEAQAWRTRQAITASLSGTNLTLVCTPLIYRQRAIGVLTAMRGPAQSGNSDAALESAPLCWSQEEIPLVAVAANVVAMLLENTRLLERDHQRIHELSLLNGITSQMNCSLRERSRVHRIIVQRTKEISLADLCEVLLPDVADAEISWIPADLHVLLLQHWNRDLHAAPLVLERVGEAQSGDYFSYLSPRIKTFFAVPLIGNRSGETAPGGTVNLLHDGGDAYMLGVIVGAYHQPWKLRREELVLLQILANQAGAVLGNIALMEEVVEARNEARRLLRQVLDDQRLKEVILESIPSGLIALDMQGQITTFNRAAETILGYHPREVIGQPLHKILPFRFLESVLQTGHMRHETVLTTGRQGQEIALDATLVSLRDDQGQQIGVQTTFADITMMRHLEEEKRRLDRLASLGEMSASVAHEVRNPLASIKTSMQMLLDDLEGNLAFQQDEGPRDSVSVVLKEVERLDGIVRDLLLFARPRQLHLVECDLLELSERALHVLQPQCNEYGVRVHLIRQDLPPALVDIAQLQQVLMNLFLNAIQAMPDGGILSVACQRISLPALLDKTALRVDPCPIPTLLPVVNESEMEEERYTWLELTVSDTGVGIAPDELVRIFQPFHTTKAHGIGLGLPITRRLIEDHHGYLLVESQLGYGTTISVRLPLSE